MARMTIPFLQCYRDVLYTICQSKLIVPETEFQLWHTKLQPLTKPSSTTSILSGKCNSPTNMPYQSGVYDADELAFLTTSL